MAERAPASRSLFGRGPSVTLGAMDLVRVFVYGSLKRGFLHHDVMRGARFVRRATVYGYCLRVVGQYPAMVPEPDGSVQGEVYGVTPEHLAALDEFEDCPDLYRREAVRLGDGSTAFAYTMTEHVTRGAPRVAGGLWSER